VAARKSAMTAKIENIDIFYLPYQQRRKLPPLTTFNPLPPSDAVRQQKKLFYRIFSVQYCRNLKKYHPSGNLKFHKLGIFQSLRLRILMEKIHTISLKLNFTPNTLGCFGLNASLKTEFLTF